MLLAWHPAFLTPSPGARRVTWSHASRRRGTILARGHALVNVWLRVVPLSSGRVGVQGVHRLWWARYKHARTRRPRHDEAPPQPEKQRCANAYGRIVSAW